jgi:hypothetical protein
VISLEGEDTLFPPYLLSENDPGDDEAIRLRTYGEYHFACLVASRWGSFWSSRLARHFILQGGFIELGEDDGFAFFGHINTGRVELVRSDGFHLTLEKRDLLHLRAEPSQTSVGRTREFTFHLEGSPHVVRAAQADLVHYGAYPLLKLVENLGVAPYLMNPAAVSRSFLRFSTDLKEHWDHGHITVMLDYPLPVPQPAVEFLTRLDLSWQDFGTIS